MKAPAPTYTVGRVARLAHLSVRAPLHYDELGLLRPTRREGSGYRLYTSEDLERLQQVLFYKELGFSLHEIRDLMTDPAFDRRAALVGQRREIAARALRLEAMLALIDKTLASLEGGPRMNDEELLDVFGDFDPSEHEDEARERWGDTAAYRESARRTKGYAKEDWARFKAESDALNADFATLMRAGATPDDPRAMDAAERHRLQIYRWFYPCPPAMHVALGEMYVADPRFATTYEKIHPGMARYVCAAIAANAARAAEQLR
jgi:DNA-binding transcriptional MerR regulator